MLKNAACLALLALCVFAIGCQKERPAAENAPAGRTPEQSIADSPYARADTLLDALRYDSAMLLLRSLAPIYFQQQDWEKYIACRRKTAYCLWASRESEKAAALCLETIPEATEKLGGSHPEIAKLCTILGNIHADKRTEKDFKKCLEYYHRALDIAKRAYADPSPELAGAYERFGIAHWLIDDYAASISWYETALTHLDSLSPKNARTYLKIYNNLGLTYFTLGHYPKAHDFFKKARDVALNIYRKKDSHIVKFLINMAQARRHLGDADEALDLLREAWALENEVGVPRSELQCLILSGMGDCFTAKEAYDEAADSYRKCLGYRQSGKRDDVNGLSLDLLSLGGAFLKKNQADSALGYFRQSYRLIDNAFDKDSYNRVNILCQLGLACQQKNEIPNARNYLQEALRIAQEKVGNHHPVTGKVKKQLADLDFGIGALDAAFEQAEGARLSYLTRDFLPGEKPAAVDINSLTEIIGVYHLMGKIRAAQHLKNQDAAALRQSVSCFTEALALTDSLKIGILTRTARQAAQKQVFAIAEDALASLHRLWSGEPRQEYLEQTFHFMEKSKAAELLASLYDFDAKQNAGVTEEWLERETLLKSQMSSYQSLLYDPERATPPGSDFKMAIFQQKYLIAKHTLDSFVVMLEKKFPKYHQLKYNNGVASLSDVRAAAAAKNAAVVEYFYGDSALHVLIVSPDSILWKKIEGVAETTPDNPSLDQSLSAFLATLADKNSQQTAPDAFFAEAHFLFQTLLPGAAVSSAKSLIIVPDGRLCYLPFEALLTAPHTGSFADAPYLLRSKAVQYAWSATLLTLPEAKRPGEDGLLQIAPFAESARDGFATLPNSLRDAPESVGAAVLSGSAATADEFLKTAPRYNVLHLSTHADAGGRGVPGIELYDQRLTLPEVYAQRFHASLVSLSACETGKGEFAEGEGVLSLARAFAYAGAQSLVASHWAVNERSTAELFSAFYTNLENGLPKAEALRQAKLDYLASPEMDARKAPFHWAAFTLTGADGQVELGHGRWWKWLFAIGGLLLFAGILMYAAQRRKVRKA